MIPSPTQALTLLSKMIATSWPLAIFYRISFIARIGKQTITFYTSLILQMRTKSQYYYIHSLWLPKSNVVIHWRCSPLNFLSKISITFPHNFISTQVYALNYAFYYKSNYSNQQLSYLITSFKTPASKIDPSRKPSFSDFKDTKNGSLHHCQLKSFKKNLLFVYLEGPTYISFIFS